MDSIYPHLTVRFGNEIMQHMPARRMPHVDLALDIIAVEPDLGYLGSLSFYTMLVG
jgi:hypothetical protein